MRFNKEGLIEEGVAEVKEGTTIFKVKWENGEETYGDYTSQDWL